LVGTLSDFATLLRHNTTKSLPTPALWFVCGRSQWPRGLMRRSAAARLLRFWVRNPPGLGCLSVVSVVCCQVEVSATIHESRLYISQTQPFIMLLHSLGRHVSTHFYVIFRSCFKNTDPVINS